MSALTDSIVRLSASADALAAAIAALPPPVDETGATAAVNAVADKLDALTASLPHA